MAHVIAVSNQKGGVGKTTTSVNLAACLGAAGYSTLLIDMDPQGNATSAVGLQPNDHPSNVYHALLGLASPAPVDLSEKMANLAILPSNQDLAGAEYELLQVENRESRLKAIVDQYRDHCQYIIIDSPPSLSLLTINVLNAADWVLVPVQAEFLALDGLTRILGLIERIKTSTNPGLDLMGVAVTLYDGRTRLAQEVLTELQNVFDKKLFQTKIVRTVRLSEAPSHGLPIIYYDFNSPGAKSYVHLCEEVVDVCQKTGARPGA